MSSSKKNISESNIITVQEAAQPIGFVQPEQTEIHPVTTPPQGYPQGYPQIQPQQSVNSIADFDEDQDSLFKDSEPSIQSKDQTKCQECIKWTNCICGVLEWFR